MTGTIPSPFRPKSSPYRVLLFDCVNTLYLPDASGLPRVRVGGKEIPSTAPLLLERLRPHFPNLAEETVHHAARAAWRWAEGERGQALAEVPAPRRFRRFLHELGSHVGSLEWKDNGTPAGLPEGLAEELLEVHMEQVTASFTFPEDHRRLLETLRGHFRLALFSNFDHGPSLRALLEHTGIAPWFDPLIISDGLGFRKPGREAFQRALALVKAPPESVLFIGDSVEDDVEGGRKAGLDVAWINRRNEPTPRDPAPTYVLPDLPALAGLLGE